LRVVLSEAKDLGVVARRSRGNLEILRSAQNDTSCQIAELVLSVSEGSLALLAMTLGVRLLHG